MADRFSFSASRRSGGSRKSSTTSDSRNTTRSSTKSSTSSGRQSYSANQTTSSNVSGAAVKKARQNFEKSVGESQLKNYQVPKSNAPGFIGAALNLAQGARQKSFEVNRDYFLKNVAGKRGYGTTMDEYKRYMSARGAGTVDAMGRNIPQRRDSVKQVQRAAVNQAPSGPTTAETSLATSAYDSSTTESEGTILTKRKGRKQTILTSSQGLGGNTNTQITKKKLLG